MNRKMNLVLMLVLLVMFISGGSKSGTVSDSPKREANGQYRVGSQVKVYDGNLEPTDAYFTYSPSKLPILGYDNTVILNFGLPYSNTALFFGKSEGSDIIGFVRYCIDKGIEWAATAKQNNVHSLSKAIPRPDGYDIDNTRVAYGLNQPNYRNYKPVYLLFSFYIGDIAENGKEETLLVMNYRTHDQARSESQGQYFCFRENDFARLKEMFSESYLAKIDKQEAEWQKSQAKQDALFE